MKNRAEVKQNRFPWYALSRYASDYWQEFDRPKILYQEIATFQAFAWDVAGKYSNNKTFLIPDAELYLLALLNSKIVWFFLSHVTSKLQGGAYAMQTTYISQIPIPTCTNKIPIESLVQQILANRNASKIEIARLENDLEAHIYQLYGLTNAEIALVESQVSR